MLLIFVSKNKLIRMKESVEVIYNVQASYVLRGANYIIDTFVYFIICWFLLFLSGVAYRLFDLEKPPLLFESIVTIKGFLSWFFVWQFYYFSMEAALQSTVGKYITGTQVVTVSGLKPEAINVLLRTFMRAIPFGGLTMNENRLGMLWRDKVTGTYVIDVKKYKQAVEMKNSFELIGTEQQD